MNKHAEWETVVHEIQPNFIHGTETWLDASISSAESLPDVYKVLRKDRPTDRHGDIFFTYHKDLPIKHRADLETKCEIMWCELQTQAR